jgi:hypothetical protein
LSKAPVFISRRNRVAQLYPWALVSLYVVPYDSQGYDGGILILPVYIFFMNRMVQSKVKVKVKVKTSIQIKSNVTDLLLFFRQNRSA